MSQILTAYERNRGWIYGILLGSLIATVGLGLARVSAQNATVPVEVILQDTLVNWTTIIGSAISLILILLKWADSIVKGRKDSAEKTKFLEVSKKLQNSLQQSDAWIKDTIVSHADDFKTFFTMIGRYPSVKDAIEAPEVNQFIQKLNAKGIDAQKEFDRWYNFASTVSGLDSNDPIISGLAEVETKLTPEGEAPIEELKVNTTVPKTKSDSDAV